MTKNQKIIDGRLKPPQKFFDWCYSQIPTIKWSNKSQTIQSGRTGCRVIEKRLTKSSRLDFYDKFHSFAIVLVTSKRIEIQSYGFWSQYINGKQSIRMQLTNFEQMSENQVIQLTERCGVYAPGLTPNFSGQGAYSGTIFFENNWENKIRDISELKYLEFPSGMRYYHLSHMYKYRSEIEQRKFEKRQKTLVKYEKVIDQYLFKPAYNSGELILEGKALSHCVGSARYTQDHANGKTTIIFVRSKDEPDKPFFTLEYKDGRIVQIRGKHNLSAPEEIQQAADKWLLEINKNTKHA